MMPGSVGVPDHKSQHYSPKETRYLLKPLLDMLEAPRTRGFFIICLAMMTVTKWSCD